MSKVIDMIGLFNPLKDLEGKLVNMESLELFNIGFKHIRLNGANYMIYEKGNYLIRYKQDQNEKYSFYKVYEEVKQVVDYGGIWQDS